MFSSVFEYFSPSSKHSTSDIEEKTKNKMGESVGTYWKKNSSDIIRNEKANVELDSRKSIPLEGKVDSRRTKELESQHRAEGNWFQPEVDEQPTFYQSRMVWDVTKGEEQMDHQMVWDLTSNCYQELPVQQVSPYLPAYHQLYPCPLAAQQLEEEEDSVVTLAPTALPLDLNLFGGVFMEFVDTLYTSTLVQYVCERTAPSEHRMAAEVLARSNLNPNAKEFNPSQDLSPQSEKLFVGGIMERTEGEVHSEEDVKLSEELKARCSSANELVKGDMKSSSQIGIHTVPSEAPCDNSACDIVFEGEVNDASKEEYEQCVRTNEGSAKEDDANEERETEDDAHEESGEADGADYEETSGADYEESRKADDANEESLEADYEENLEAGDAHEENLEADYEESEDWWDSDEEPCTPSQEIDPAEFEDLFCCPLSLTSLHPTKQTTSTFSKNGNSLPPSPPSPSPPSSSFTSVATISLAAAAPTKAETRLEIVNRAFNEKYSTTTSKCIKKSNSAKVHFSDEATWQVIEEPEELADDLCEARCSDLEQRRADRERMERLLGPVLTPVHRRRMYCKIYGDLEEERWDNLEEECYIQPHLEERSVQP